MFSPLWWSSNYMEQLHQLHLSKQEKNKTLSRSFILHFISLVLHYVHNNLRIAPRTCSFVGFPNLKFWWMKSLKMEKTKNGFLPFLHIFSETEQRPWILLLYLIEELLVVCVYYVFFCKYTVLSLICGLILLTIVYVNVFIYIYTCTPWFQFVMKCFNCRV